MKHLVLSNYRCGTTWYCKHLAEKNSANNFDEIFHDNFSSKQKLKGGVLYLESKDPVVAKIFPTHIDSLENSNLVSLFGKIVNKSKVYYIKRRDVKAQVDSYIKALHMGFNKKIDWHADIIEHEEIVISRSQYEDYVNFILVNNAKIKRIADTPGLDVETIIFEDFALVENRYNRNITLTITN